MATTTTTTTYNNNNNNKTSYLRTSNRLAVGGHRVSIASSLPSFLQVEAYFPYSGLHFRSYVLLLYVSDW